MAPNATDSLPENHDGSHGGDEGENLEDKSQIFCLSAPQETKNEHTLASFGAHTLTLYKFKIGVPEKETIKKSNEGHISGRDVVYLDKEELSHPFSRPLDTLYSTNRTFLQ